MRLTNPLRAQHFGFAFKKKWYAHGKMTIPETSAREILEARGIQVADPKKVVDDRPILKMPEIVGYLPKEVKYDETHQYWNNEKCFMHGDSNMLLEGLRQAQVLTKTVLVDKLPAGIERTLANLKISSYADDNMQNAILSSHVFDAEQKKLPKVKLPNRPTINLPRFLGITDTRRFQLLMSKAIMECEKLAGRSMTTTRKLISDAFFVVPFMRDESRIQSEITVETFMTAKRPISVGEPVTADVANAELPDLSPLNFTISLPQENIYKIRDIYRNAGESILNGNSYMYPHTIFVHYSPLKSSNLFGSPVTESQIKAQSLLKAFTVAAANARALYGSDVKDLPIPIVVQCIQTDGKSFYFGVFQLNSLNLNGTTGIKNYWHHVPNIDLYRDCGYFNAVPTLEGYNGDVLRYLYAFYKNN